MLLTKPAKKFTLIFIFICSQAVALYSTANAQDKKKQFEEPTASINSFARYIPARRVSTMPGEIGITSAASEYVYEFKIAKKLPVSFFLGSQYVGINNTTEIDLPAKLTGINTGVETTFPFFTFSNTYLRLRASPAFYSDDWSVQACNFRIPTRSFLIYQPTQRWTFIAGIALYPKFKNSALPIAGFIYKPNDLLTYTITPRNPNINYKLAEQADLFIEAGFSAQEFIVNKSGIENVILEYNETRLAAGVKYKFSKLVQSAFAIGGVFNRSLKYLDDSGKAIIKNSVYTEFKVNINI